MTSGTRDDVHAASTVRTSGGMIAWLAEVRVTQQYLIGEFSALLQELQPLPGEKLAGVVRDLRREVERSPVQMLPRLAQEAIGLSDVICWAALERGDRDGFRRYAKAAAALGDFTDSAGFRPEYAIRSRPPATAVPRRRLAWVFYSAAP